MPKPADILMVLMERGTNILNPSHQEFPDRFVNSCFCTNTRSDALDVLCALSRKVSIYTRSAGASKLARSIINATRNQPAHGSERLPLSKLMRSNTTLIWYPFQFQILYLVVIVDTVAVAIVAV